MIVFVFVFAFLYLYLFFVFMDKSKVEEYITPRISWSRGFMAITGSKLPVVQNVLSATLLHFPEPILQNVCIII